MDLESCYSRQSQMSTPDISKDRSPSKSHYDVIEMSDELFNVVLRVSIEPEKNRCANLAKAFWNLYMKSSPSKPRHKVKVAAINERTVALVVEE